MTTRRSVLAALGAVPQASRLAWGGNRIDRSRLSAITDEIARTPADAIAFAQKYRLRWLEVRGVPGAKKSYTSLTADELKQARREFDDGGVKISFLNTGLLKFVMPGTEPARPPRNETPESRERRVARDAAQFERRMDDLRKAIQAAHALGVADMRVFTFLRTAEPQAQFPRIVDIIGEMARVADKEGVRLLVENEASCNVATCAELAEIVKPLPARVVGMNWDPHNGRGQEPPFPANYAVLPKNRLWNVQVKGRGVLPGPERMDWRAIITTLERDGYGGKIGLETHIFDDRLIEWSHQSMQEMLRLTGDVS